MASTSKRSDVDDTKPTNPPTSDDHSGGDSPPRNLQKRQSCQSPAPHNQLNATRVTLRASPSPTPKLRIEKKEKQTNTTESPKIHPKQWRSKSSSPDGQRGYIRQSPSRRKTPDLPPYIRATIAEQLAPVGTRRPREDTKDNLFGQDNRPWKTSTRCREDTQKTLFGEPEPSLAVRKSSRHLGDTKRNLFGPPPEVPHRQKSRILADTPGILSHELQPQTDLRETQLHAIVSRYVLRYQDTHQKLFGAPEPLRKPPPRLTSNVFSDDPAPNQNKEVKSLPLSNLIVTRESKLPSPPEISQN